MILSRKYKDAMNKITVDEQMKNRILKNINNDKEIEFNEHSKNKNTIIVKHKYYRNLGIVAACCAIVIYTLNNKYIFDSHIVNRNSDQNIEIAFNESEESNETSKSRERIEADLKNNEGSLGEIPDTSENGSIVAETSPLERKISKYTGDIISEAGYIERGSTEEEFKTLDELKKSIDFTIKTPKVESESNEIKSIVMDSSENISIEYENKDYSLIFKIEKESNEENLYNSQYKMEKVMNIDGKPVLLKGNADLINIASWREDNIYFEIESISGIKEEEIINIIKNIE